MQEWENARAQLATAIQTYVSTTKALEEATASCSTGAFYNPSPSLEKELESLSLWIDELNKTRVVLAKTRNLQHPPISRLPPELLVSIFRIVVDYAYPEYFPEFVGYANPATTLICVCSDWRRIALEFGPLWSCVVLAHQIGRSYKDVLATARMQLERTRGSPIDIFLLSELFYIAGDTELQPIPNLLGPYLKQLRSLSIQQHRNKDIESILDCCLENGAVGSLSELEVFGHSSIPIFHQANSQKLGQLDELLRSVRVLKLHSVTFDWNSAVFEQLDELVLDYLLASSCPSLTQLAGALSASPGLRSLTINQTRIHGGVESIAQPSVELRNLEILMLDRLNEVNFRRLASVLSLKGQRLDLRMLNDFNNPKLLEVLRLFASETNVEAFRLIGVPSHQPIPQILESLPDLQHLGLAGLKLGDSDLNALVHRNTMERTVASSPSPPTRTDTTSTLPKIKGVGLVKCTIVSDEAMFKDAISSASFTYLRLDSCTIETKKGLLGGDDSTRVLHIDATTQLGIWLTENCSGQVIIV